MEFPEVRGALHKFLRVLSPVWNISLFHYRQSGNRSSTILLGMQASRRHAYPPPRLIPTHSALRVRTLLRCARQQIAAVPSVPLLLRAAPISGSWCYQGGRQW